MKLLKSIASAAISAAILASCSGEAKVKLNHSQTIPAPGSALPKAEKQMTQAELLKLNDENSFKLLRESCKEEKNLFFSPISINTALSMAYSGARGESAEEFQKAFVFSKDQNAQHQSFKEVIDKLNYKGEKSQISLANAYWLQKDFPLKKEAANILKKAYNCELFHADFKTNGKGIADDVQQLGRGQKPRSNQKYQQWF